MQLCATSVSCSPLFSERKEEISLYVTLREMARTNNLSVTFQGCCSKFFIDLINHLRIVIKIVLQELTMITSFNENDKWYFTFMIWECVLWIFVLRMFVLLACRCVWYNQQSPKIFSFGFQGLAIYKYPSQLANSAKVFVQHFKQKETN